MYITRVEIENIKSIKHLVWEINADKAAGWHVILGDNGAGKTTFLQAIAISLIGMRDFAALRLDLWPWLKRPSKSGSARIFIANNLSYKAGHLIKSDDNWIPRRTGFKLAQIGERVDLVEAPGTPSLWLQDRGWFCASYGSFRRFTGGDKEEERLFHTNQLVARHLSTFSESFALTEGPKWLEALQFKSLEGDEQSAALINNIFAFVNQDNFLPNGTRIVNISSGGIHFVDNNGGDLLIGELSEGFRSVLSFTFELIRQLSLTYGADVFDPNLGGGMVPHPKPKINVVVPGVVLIDEIDAHLHPTWQKQIGFWLTEHFPNIQFIVTTHSPLVCQASEKGSIFRLPTPGTDENGKMLEGSDRDRLLYGDILDAYSTQAFGFGVTRSERSQQMLERLSDLNMREIMEGLTEDESAEQDRLREMLPTTGSVLPAKFAA